MTNWHRLFGLLLCDFFSDSPFDVELEKDLALRKQLLDVVVLQRRPGKFDRPLPDGLDDLATHNLITFKSHQDVLDDWALKELTGHYVNYRKQCQSSNQPLLPESDFRLYAVCSRHPDNLAGAVQLEPVQEGVFECRRGTDSIRIIVAAKMPRTAQNAVWHLFSASGEQVAFGTHHYEQRSEETNTLIQELLGRYQREGFTMSYTMADWRRDFILEHFKELTPEERRKALQGLPPEERLEGLSAEERVEGMSVDELENLSRKLKSRRKPGRRA
jgi:hypothetical protein